MPCICHVLHLLVLFINFSFVIVDPISIARHPLTWLNDLYLTAQYLTRCMTRIIELKRAPDMNTNYLRLTIISSKSYADRCKYRITCTVRACTTKQSQNPKKRLLTIHMHNHNIYSSPFLLCTKVKKMCSCSFACHKQSPVQCRYNSYMLLNVDAAPNFSHLYLCSSIPILSSQSLALCIECMCICFSICWTRRTRLNRSSALV